MLLISWNVNGLRAVEKKGFGEWLENSGADIISIQETKAQKDQLEESLTDFPGYYFYHSENTERKGYCGVACYTKEKPIAVREGLADESFTPQGRVLRLEFERFYLYNIYFPNGGGDQEKFENKQSFNEALYSELKELIKGDKGIIICGDVNIAHEDIDLKNPKANSKHSGFLPLERRFIDRLLDLGFTDSFRHLHPEEEKYSWWSYRYGAKRFNAGWRIDYFFVSNNLKPYIVGADIDEGMTGSDHVPISLELNFEDQLSFLNKE